MRQDKMRGLFRFLDVALFIFVVGFSIIVYMVSDSKNTESIIWVFLIYTGTMLFLFFLLAKRFRYLFFSILFVLNGITALIINSDYLPYTFFQLWPIMGIIFSMSLFLTCLYRYRKIKTAYAIPCAMFFVISIFFMIFSFSLVSFSFRKFMLVLAPLCVSIVFVWYFLQKKFDGRI